MARKWEIEKEMDKLGLFPPEMPQSENMNEHCFICGQPITEVARQRLIDALVNYVWRKCR